MRRMSCWKPVKVESSGAQAATASGGDPTRIQAEIDRASALGLLLSSFSVEIWNARKSNWISQAEHSAPILAAKV